MNAQVSLTAMLCVLFYFALALCLALLAEDIKDHQGPVLAELVTIAAPKDVMLARCDCSELDSI